jgi:hypothetical protein
MNAIETSQLHHTRFDPPPAYPRAAHPARTAQAIRNRKRTRVD